MGTKLPISAGKATKWNSVPRTVRLLRTPGRPRAGGSSKRSRQEAPEEMIVSPPQAGPLARAGQGSAKDRSSQEGPRTDGRWPTETAPGLPGMETGGGSRTGPKLGRDAFARKRLRTERRRGPGPPKPNGEVEQGSSDRSAADPGSDGRAGWMRRTAARRSRAEIRGRSPGDRAADRDRRDA